MLLAVMRGKVKGAEDWQKTLAALQQAEETARRTGCREWRTCREADAPERVAVHTAWDDPEELEAFLKGPGGETLRQHLTEFSRESWEEVGGRRRLVQDLMHPGIVCCPPETSAGEMARIMLGQNTYAVAVGPAGPAGCRGIVTERELTWAFEEGRAAAPARDLMTPAPVAVSARASLEEAADLMLSKGLPNLLVVDPQEGNRPVGTLSVGDLAEALAEGGAAG
ncbi:MAG: CBS domain-containing protein [Thermaerobacter sp.]|jgi:CBS domain-containing protein/quinol monooxygenase YgiN|nr:CBS domain-containing protein [Thermaerobacter sp.]